MKVAIWMRLLRLLVQRLEAPLGPSRYLFMLLLTMRRRGYLARYADPRDDAGLRDCKRMLVWFAMIHHELRHRVGDREALRIALDVTRSVAVVVQRSLYQTPAAPALDALITLHRRHREKGLFRHIEYADVKSDDHQYDYRVTRCRFHEAFTAMGVPGLTQAFCESDEIVFNSLTPALRFHRAGRATIARGGEACTFHFESGTSSRPIPDAAFAAAGRDEGNE